MIQTQTLNDLDRASKNLELDDKFRGYIETEIPHIDITLQKTESLNYLSPVELEIQIVDVEIATLQIYIIDRQVKSERLDT